MEHKESIDYQEGYKEGYKERLPLPNLIGGLVASFVGGMMFVYMLMGGN